jgi:KipI family sensor histidine kinase inhibitor
MSLRPKTSKLEPRIEPYGDYAVLVSYDVEGYSEKACKTVHRLADVLRGGKNWTNVIPAYDSLMLTFNPAGLSTASAVQTVKRALSHVEKSKRERKPKPIDIPVFYGGENGPDMETICKSAKLSENQVIKRHSANVYRVCMMGFIPGFTFLSATDKKLHHPRLKTPRANVAAGSIGIANWQTGIYGLESPGGWQIIGRTPLNIFDAKRDDPFALKAGDIVRFIPQGSAS